MAYSSLSKHAGPGTNKLGADNELLRLSRNLVPTEVDVKDAKKIADQIFRTLRGSNKYAIDRVKIIGSLEKKTALACEFDLDCVVFINDVTIHEFPEILEYFKWKLEESFPDTEFQIPKTNGVPLMQANIDDFKIDIVPAINYSQNTYIQRESVLKEIRKLKDPCKGGYRYSSSLLQYQVDFIKEQTPFVHDVIRLAKYWNKTIFIENYVSGRSTMIELIAIVAANKIEKELKITSLTVAFKQFLEYMMDLEDVEITFDHSRIELYLRQQRPLVVDPSNPYNNFAYDLYKNGDIREKFELYAKVTLERLCNGNPLDLLVLFKLQMPVVKFRDRHKESWIISVEDNNSGSKKRKIVERNVEGVRKTLKTLKHFFMSNVKFIDLEGMSKDDLLNKVADIIDELDKNWKLLMSWTKIIKIGHQIQVISMICKHRTSNTDDVNDKHGDRDITFKIPVGNKLILGSCDL